MEQEPELEPVEMDLDITVTGRVVDAESNEPLMGVTVFVLGTQRGTTTGPDGRFTLEVPDNAEILAFSFVGYVRQEITIGDRTEFNVRLVSDVAMLDDIVVVGYGTQQRFEVTGSISSINVENIRDIQVTSFENAIQGQIAGVNVQEVSGEPGSTPEIQIRGTGSISAGNDPLYVIDGLPMNRNVNLQGSLFTRRASFTAPTVNPMAALNPNDIASIEVLKDAAAAAIYGSRGSNGVIMITTHKGQSREAPIIRLSSTIGVQSDFNRKDMMNAEEFIDFTQDARNNNYLQKYDPLNPASPNYNPNYNPANNVGRPANDANVLLPESFVNFDGTDTDWLDEIFRNSARSNVNASVSGGTDNITYYLSGGYLNQDGIIKGSGFERYTFRTNVAADLTNRLKVDANINLSFSDQDRVPADAPYFANPPGIVYSAFIHSPTVRPLNEDGTPNQLNNHSHLGGAMTTTSNPLGIMEGIQEEISNNRQFGTINARYSLLDNLNYQATFGFDLDNYQRSFFRTNEFLFRDATVGESQGQASSSQGRNWILENTLNYSANLFEDHRLDFFIGGSAQKQRDEINSIIAFNFPDDNVRTINAGQVTDGNHFIEEWSLVSAITRANYSIRDTYLISGALRVDRSSRFGPGNKTGFFPSVSVGWRLTQEPFFEQDLFNELKLRASFGVTGNFLIPNFASFGLMERQNTVIGNEIVAGLVQSTLGDDDLSWEQTRDFNAGFDFALLSDRIFGSIDYYYSRTDDLLLNVSIPAALGFTTALTNIGEVENEGLEISLTTRNIMTPTFQWSTDLNFATNRNEVLSLAPGVDAILSQGAAGIRHITRVGSPIGSYFGHVVEGIYQTQQEIDNAPQDLLAPAPRPGDFRFKDINGDGVIDNNDRTTIGNYQPDFTFGFTNRIGYRDWNLSFLFQGVVGRDILNLTSRHIKNGEANFNAYSALNDRWRSPEEPGGGVHPRADRQTGLHGNNNRPSSYQVEDGSYIRLRNVTLGYNVPQSILGNVVNSVRVTATATNLWISTEYLGFNPEVSTTAGGSLTPGQDIGVFPLTRTFSIGIDVTF